MATAHEIFETKEIVRTETTLTGVSLHLTLEEASMLRSLLGQVITSRPLENIFDELYSILPNREYDVEVAGATMFGGIYLRKVK